MKRSKFLIITILLAGGMALFWQIYFAPKELTDRDLAQKRQEILAQPKISTTNLSEETLQKFLEEFKVAKEAALSANLDSPQTLHEMASIKRRLGDAVGAIIIWDYLSEIRPKNALAFAQMGEVYHYELQDYELAEKNYLKALVNDPRDTQTIRNLFDLYFRELNDKARAEALILEAIEVNPKAAELYLLAGSFYGNLDQNQKALVFYQKYLELDPGSGAVLNEVERLKKALEQ